MHGCLRLGEPGNQPEPCAGAQPGAKSCTARRRTRVQSGKIEFASSELQRGGPERRASASAHSEIVSILAGPRHSFGRKGALK